MALFPGKFIHIGGDEAVKDQWKASPKVQARMKELGIRDEIALQGYFTTRIARFLAAHGRRAIGWDEILEGGLPEGAAVMSWRGVEGATIAAKAGPRRRARRLAHALSRQPPVGLARRAARPRPGRDRSRTSTLRADAGRYRTPSSSDTSWAFRPTSGPSTSAPRPAPPT